MRCGYVSVSGRPNVGKSTLVNRLVGQKITITSRKPQTTRHRIIGIREDGDSQMVLVDTPGLHRPGKKTINRIINKTAKQSLVGVDVGLLLVSAHGWKEQDTFALGITSAHAMPLILVINKADLLPNKDQLLPLIDKFREKHDFAAIVPLSAKKGHNIDSLVDAVKHHLPQNDRLFPDEQVTDRSVRFLVSELVREQLFRQLGQELPYETAVEIESFQDSPAMTRINALIWVEKPSQKNIVLGEKGRTIKRIGERARKQISSLVEKKVYLGLWVKVKSGWAENQGALRSLGYLEE